MQRATTAQNDRDIAARLRDMPTGRDRSSQNNTIVSATGILPAARCKESASGTRTRTRTHIDKHSYTSGSGRYNFTTMLHTTCFFPGPCLPFYNPTKSLI